MACAGLGGAGWWERRDVVLLVGGAGEAAVMPAAVRIKGGAAG